MTKTKNGLKVIAVLITLIMLMQIIPNISSVKFNVQAASVFKTYNLTETELKKIASLCQQEQGTAKGAAAEASLMANRFEMYGSKFSSVYDYARNSGWFAKAGTYMDKMNATDAVIEAVRNVLIYGKRTLPGYIDEHDCFSDLKSCTNNGVSITIKDRSQYKQFVTIINNVYGSKYTFYCFPTSSSDPFGYISETKRSQIGEAYYDYDTGKLINGKSVPDPPMLSINKNSGTPNDIINITWNAVKYADSYWLHIYRDGADYINQTLNQNLSYSAKYPAGNYTAYVVSCNSQGESLSSVDFSICDSNPEKPAPYIEKKSYSINETVTITWNKTQLTDSYWLHIYRNGEDYINQTLNQNLSYSAIYPVGNYTAFIVSCNGVGETLSSVEFSVYDTAPEKTSPKIIKDIYYTDETVEIAWGEIANTDYYWLHIYRDGKDYINQTLNQNLSFSATYPAGNYTAYIVSCNGIGETISNVNFNVIKKGDINADDEFNISDAVLLQKWLLGMSNIEIKNWKAADLCEDGKLDVFDLCMMKRMLVERN